METNAIFRKNYGSFRRFFSMLGKADLPYLWIIGYLAASAVIANVGVSTTEYSAALFAGNVGLTAVVLPYLFYQILSLVLGSVSGLINNLCEARMDRNLRRMVWRKTVSLPLRFYENNNPKELLSRITTDISSISNLVMKVFLPIFTTAYASFVILQKVSSYDGALMWSLVAALPVNILISFILGRLQFGVQDLINRRNAQLTATVAERTNNLMLIKSMGTEEKEAGVGGERMKASYRAAGMNIWITGMAVPIRAIASVLQTIVIILVGRGYYASGALSLTEWIAYYGFAIQLTNILSAYCGYWTSFKSAQGAVDRVSEIMAEPSENLNAGSTMESPTGGIHFEKVDFSFGNEPLFKGLDLDIPAGRITAVVGPSGSGKTTLLRRIAAVMLPRGDIRAGYMPQSYTETVDQSLTPVEFLTGGSGEKAVLTRAKTCLGSMKYTPEECSHSISGLSGGQKAKLFLLKMILDSNNVLILDEPTRNFSPLSGPVIRRMLKDFPGCIISVSHDRRFIEEVGENVYELTENGLVKI